MKETQDKSSDYKTVETTSVTGWVRAAAHAEEGHGNAGAVRDVIIG